jgi:uncharacterized protein YjgD (DUF1641 family)
MALSREKAKKPSKGIPLKSSKAAVKAAKSVKKPAPAKVAAPVKAKTKATVAAQPEKAKTSQLIEKAKSALKAALKTEKPVSASVVVAPLVEAVPVKTKAKVRKISIEASANEAASALAAKWATLYKKAEQIDAKPYNMKQVFEEKTAIVHKVLGWGYILANRNDRLEVLFKDGIKHLISNYKP